MSEDVIFELSEIEVETLGLVNQGANREEFFLMKNAEDQEVLSEIEAATADTITKTVWQRIMGLFQKAATEVMPNEVDETEAEAEDEVESETITVAEAEVGKATPEELTSPTPTVVSPVVEPETEVLAVKTAATTTTSVDPTTVVLIKEDQIMEENVMAENEFSKADYEAIAKRLELAETELAKAREEKAQQVWLTKTAGYGYLPVAQAELAGKLYSIAKLDGALAEWVAEVFKAVDNMVADSGMFVEKGHNIPEVDAITKAMQSADPKAALLGLPKAEAEAYLAAVRARSK